MGVQHIMSVGKEWGEDRPAHHKASIGPILDTSGSAVVDVVGLHARPSLQRVPLVRSRLDSRPSIVGIHDGQPATLAES